MITYHYDLHPQMKIPQLSLIDEMYAIYGEDRNLINVGADFTVVGDHLPESNDWLYDYRLHTLSPITMLFIEKMEVGP